MQRNDLSMPEELLRPEKCRACGYDVALLVERADYVEQRPRQELYLDAIAHAFGHIIGKVAGNG